MTIDLDGLEAKAKAATPMSELDLEPIKRRLSAVWPIKKHVTDLEKAAFNAYAKRDMALLITEIERLRTVIHNMGQRQKIDQSHIDNMEEHLSKCPYQARI